ncbi:tRNA (5-methylaminomethyl-2-thiouridine)(34)-methyltransferase MnmD [Bacteroidia bacterium]|nr:tRNA (5-methylaminomethyl-2-thiouridine)(34)-methyltransferase MnmD [Bacteroidia bacterium]
MELHETSNGEKTLYIPSMDETYHSRNGAISESKHVFIKQGIHRTQGNIHILEIGFGTGLNALLTAIESEKMQRKIKYHTLEPFPVPNHLITALNYGHWLKNSSMYDAIHDTNWENENALTDTFFLHKTTQKLEYIKLKDSCYDIVFFDAFAPKKQPDLWSEPIFSKLSQSLKKGGILTTYSAAGQLKRDLKACGFVLEHPSGANGKREMTVAIKP